MTGIDQSVLSKIEKGFIEVNAERKVKIARVLNVKPEVLFPSEKGKKD